ncbi:hypothetical protein [Nonomuraea jiangxiensis]|uniref:Uncharacterized protein n=1 Tax=Nonomuraea jiangxiensis TaxID=633440 RepID=A0A1G9RVU2_9ACTN|nr:hypothetical protein [Nonomuraea jiangxiensis]SDM27351.1 hypothetical protein SAMN05421869_13979 [Nonomuraea jiangxiensis]
MTTFDTAVAQARDLLRWRSPLRTELWAGRLAAGLEPGQVEPFLRRLAEDGSAESRLTLAALAAVDQAAEAASGESDGTVAAAGSEDRSARPHTVAGSGMAGALPGWVRLMTRVRCEGAWYGKGDPYGEQTLAALSFCYENGKEPHLLVVGIDQVSGGLAVDALVEEVKFLDDLELRAADPGVVAGRVLDAFELGDRILGVAVADTLPAVRPIALARAHAVPDLVRPAPDDTLTRFRELPELPGAREAFEKLAEFVGDRPLWWSPARASRFLTSWLPREAILSEAGIAAMPDVVRAWSRFSGGHPAVLDQVEADAPRLAALMADESLAGLGKRIAQSHRRDS